MSDENRFQKTFTRRKKAYNDVEDHVAEEDAVFEDEVLLVAPSLTAESKGEGRESDIEVPREPISNGGGANVTRKQQPKQKRKEEEEEQSQPRKQKKQRKQDLKTKPKQKQVGKKQIAEDGSKEPKKEDSKEDEPASTECRFPVSRVDKIIRSEVSDYRITHEAVFLINKASEKFLDIFCRGSYQCAAHDRKNYVSYNHLSTAVSKDLRFDFLSDYVPEKVKADKALAEQKPVEK